MVLEDEGCCGSLDLHAGSEQTAKMRIKQNIDRIAPHLNEVECVLSSASGCGLTMKEWGRVLAQDETYDAEELTERMKDHALFVAFAPVDDPRIAVAVIVENGGHGGATAAPIAGKIIKAWLTPKIASGEITISETATQ